MGDINFTNTGTILRSSVFCIITVMVNAKSNFHLQPTVALSYGRPSVVAWSGSPSHQTHRPVLPTSPLADGWH